MMHHHKEASDKYAKNNGSSVVTLTPPHAGKSKLDNTTPKISILFNQLEDKKFGYFGNFEFVDIQRDHHKTFGGDTMIFTYNLTNQNKNMVDKELYAFSELSMFDVFIHVIRNVFVGKESFDDSRSTQEV